MSGIPESRPLKPKKIRAHFKVVIEYIGVNPNRELEGLGQTINHYVKDECPYITRFNMTRITENKFKSYVGRT